MWIAVRASVWSRCESRSAIMFSIIRNFASRNNQIPLSLKRDALGAIDRNSTDSFFSEVECL